MKWKRIVLIVVVSVLVYVLSIGPAVRLTSGYSEFPTIGRQAVAIVYAPIGLFVEMSPVL
jgi:hypothetical protein